MRWIKMKRINVTGVDITLFIYEINKNWDDIYEFNLVKWIEVLENLLNYYLWILEFLILF